MDIKWTNHIQMKLKHNQPTKDDEIFNSLIRHFNQSNLFIICGFFKVNICFINKLCDLISESYLAHWSFKRALFETGAFNADKNITTIFLTDRQIRSLQRGFWLDDYSSLTSQPYTQPPAASIACLTKH